MRRMPVTIVSGFAGAGKSTLIDRVRQGLSGSRLGIIRDDGERDLLGDLERLAEERACEYVIVESPPDGEPFTTAEFLVYGDEYGPSPSEFCRVDCVATVVDASTFLRDVQGGESLADRELNFDETDERTVPEVLVEQVEFADVIVLNKIDLISELERARLLALLSRLNPRAKILPSVRARVQARDLIDTGYFDFFATDEGAGWLAELDGEFKGLGSVEGVMSFSFHDRRPFHPVRLNEFLAEFEANGIKGMVRAKGSLWVATRHHEIGVWSLTGRTSLLTYGGAWFAATPVREWPKDERDRAEIMREWKPPFGDRRQEIAFIGIELDEASLRARLQHCLLTDAEMVDGPVSWNVIQDPLPDWHFDTDEEPYSGDDG